MAKASEKKRMEAAAARPPRLLYLMKRWYSAAKLRLDEIARKQDLTTAEYTMLSFLKRFEPCSAAELAREERITPQAATQQVAQLKAKGLVTSRENEANRRISLITMTGLGRARHAAVSAEARVLEEDMLAGLGEKELDALFAFLARSTEAAARSGGRDDE